MENKAILGFCHISRCLAISEIVLLLLLPFFLIIFSHLLAFEYISRSLFSPVLCVLLIKKKPVKISPEREREKLLAFNKQHTYSIWDGKICAIMNQLVQHLNPLKWCEN
jgi:hypothetical protein